MSYYIDRKEYCPTCSGRTFTCPYCKKTFALHGKGTSYFEAWGGERTCHPCSKKARKAGLAALRKLAAAKASR